MWLYLVRHCGNLLMLCFPPSNPVWFGVFCLSVKRDNYPHRIFRSQRYSLTVKRNCIAPNYTSLNYRLHQNKWGNLKKRTILLYFCIYIDFLKDFLPLWWVAAHFVCWSVPSMKKKTKKTKTKQQQKKTHFEQLPWRNYWSYAFKHSCSFFLSFYCNNSC